MWNFLKSATKIDTNLVYNFSQIIFIGRSNVGKSTLINTITNNKSLSYTSKRPGRTRTINYFLNTKNNSLLVDLPGYGYATGSKVERLEIVEIIDAFLNDLTMIDNDYKFLLLIDSRHGITKIDKLFIDDLKRKMIEFNIIFTKADKINQSEKSKLLKDVENLNLENIHIVSSKTKFGIVSLKKYLKI